MKSIFIILLIIFISLACSSQEVLRIKNGGIVTVQNGVELTLQGGLTLETGSGLANNGIVRLRNNLMANESNWTDLSAGGALIGNGQVIFNSINNHNFSGPTNFYSVQMNGGGLTLNNNFHVSNLLHLIHGKINTGNNYIFLNNDNALSLLNDPANQNYANSWVNGNFRRLITVNTSTYDFPVGNSTRSNLLQFINGNVGGTGYLTALFGAKPGTDAGLNVVENGAMYTAINNGGVWRLVPDAPLSGGNYALQLYFNGFTGLTDNQFGILRRPDASLNAVEWAVPPGSSLEAINGPGRKISDGFARRFNISSFSQWGIGMMNNIPCENCAVACTYSQGFYGNKNGAACFNNSGTNVTSTQLMLNAFGATTSKVFGNVVNKRFFTLYKTDISNGNIFKMLPGLGNSQPIMVDNILPYNGAFYSDQSTWYLVPIPTNGNQKGRINNQLLSQLITLWFNLQTSNSLGGINLINDTLVTIGQTACGSGTQIGNPVKFGIPHSVILYLNGGNGYSHTVNGLFQLANDILGGANTAVPAPEIQNAVATVNNAFDGCKILKATIPYSQNDFITSIARGEFQNEVIAEGFSANVHPNPTISGFSIIINSRSKEKIAIQVVDMLGRIIETRNVNANSMIRFGDRYIPGTYFVRIIQGKQHKEIKLIKLSN